MSKSGIAGCVHKMPKAFKSGAELRKAIETSCRFYGSKNAVTPSRDWSKGECTESPSPNGSGTLDLSSLIFERLDPNAAMVPFSELHGSVIYGVRRMGWRVRQGWGESVCASRVGKRVCDTSIAISFHAKCGWFTHVLIFNGNSLICGLIPSPSKKCSAMTQHRKGDRGSSEGPERAPRRHSEGTVRTDL